MFRRALVRLKSTAVALDFLEMPSPKGLPLVGTTLEFIANGSAPQLHKYIEKRHKQLGSIFREKLGPVSCVFVSDPHVIRAVYDQEGKYPIHITPEAWTKYNELYKCPRGLFFMEGEEWWHFRRIVNGYLMKGDLKWMEEACDVASENLVEKINSEGNLRETLYKWSLDNMVAILLGAESYQKHHKELEDEVTKFAKMVHLIFETTSKLYVIPINLASKLRIPQWRRFVQAVNEALTTAKSLVQKMNQLKPKMGLLSKLNQSMTPSDVDRIIVDLVIAAGDTTASTLEWMLYCISKNCETQNKLRQHPEFSKFVLKETLRLYPIAAFLTRILPNDAVIGGFGIPKFTPVVMSLYTSGRNERIFPDACSFKPERWDRSHPDYNSEMHKASLPFAMGIRSCVGKKMAEIQLQAAILKVVRRYHLELENKQDVDIVMRMVAQPAQDLLLKFTNL